MSDKQWYNLDLLRKMANLQLKGSVKEAYALGTNYLKEKKDIAVLVRLAFIMKGRTDDAFKAHGESILSSLQDFLQEDASPLSFNATVDLAVGNYEHAKKYIADIYNRLGKKDGGKVMTSLCNELEKRMLNIAHKKALEFMIKHEPENAIALHKFGELELKAGNYADAFKHFKNSLEHRRDIMAVVRSLGKLVGAIHAHDEHQDLLRQVLEFMIKHEPENAITLHQFGEFELEVGNYADAFKHFKNSLEHRRDIMAVVRSLGKLAAAAIRSEEVGLAEEILDFIDQHDRGNQISRALREQLRMNIGTVGWRNI